MPLLQHPDRIDIPSTLGPFPPGGEEGRVPVGVDGMDLDVLRRDATIFENPLVCLEEVDMMAAGHGTSVSRTFEGPDDRHGKTGIPELLRHLFAHLETFWADGRADDDLKVFRVCPESLSHEVDCALGYLQDRPFPA